MSFWLLWMAALIPAIYFGAAFVLLLVRRWLRWRLSRSVRQITVMYGEITEFEQERALCARFVEESSHYLEE